MPQRIITAVALVAILLSYAVSSIAATAEENYKFYCAQCHGLEGKGDGPNATKNQPVSPRDHTNAAEMNKLTDDDIINSITDGGPATSKSSLMPPFGKTLAKQEITALKDYLRKLCKCKGK
ncbi:MAG: cytochrome c [Deltaproteobacteria bacterium]|nr:cytochrome c [Deltaproteobacteria bacterium]